jgi:hypothetical protein
MKPGPPKCVLLCPKCTKTHLRASTDFKKFSEGCIPGPPFRGGEGKGGEEREGEGRRRGRKLLPAGRGWAPLKSDGHQKKKIQNVSVDGKRWLKVYEKNSRH